MQSASKLRSLALCGLLVSVAGVTLAQGHPPQDNRQPQNQPHNQPNQWQNHGNGGAPPPGQHGDNGYRPQPQPAPRPAPPPPAPHVAPPPPAPHVAPPPPGPHAMQPPPGPRPGPPPQPYFHDRDRNDFYNHYRHDADQWRYRPRPPFAPGVYLEPRYVVQPVPHAYWGPHMAPPPPGYAYGYYGGYVVVYNPTTRIIADVLDIISTATH